MRTKKIVIVLSLVFTILLLNACGDNTGTNGDDLTESQATETEVIETTEMRYTPNLPELDFGGEEFRVLGIDPATYNICLDFDIEEETGDVLSDSIYLRNRTIEEKYNVKFVSSYLPEYPNTTDKLKNIVLAQSDEYEMIMVINRDAFSSALAGYITPLANIPHIDITQPWYHNGVNDQFAIKGKMFFAYTDECLNMYSQTLAALFNKKLISDYNLESPYQYVLDGTWTMDKFYEMAISVINDVNGDGVYDTTDIQGITTEPDMFFPSFWIGSNVRTVNINNEGIPEFTALSDEKFMGILDKMHNWVMTDGFYIESFSSFGGGEEARVKGSQHFSQNMSMFRVGVLASVLDLRNMDADFGILPLPKYDEAQKNYVSRMIDGWIHVVPMTNTKLELTGAMIEALGAESKNEVIPTFFDIALKTKISRDNESAEMLDILFDNLTVDLGDTVWQSTIRWVITDHLNGKRDGFTSLIEKMVNPVDKLINDALTAVDNLE